MFRSSILAVSLCVAAWGCGGSPEPDDGTGEGESAGGEGGEGHVSAIAALGITGPDVPWAEMSAFDKEMYMVGKVLPIMQELFRRHDAAEFAEYGCETCHGDAMRELAFRMPPPSSFVVPPEGTPAFEGMVATFPEMVRFMREEVTPSMGTLLGISDFTCAGCHPSAAPEAP